MLGNSPDFIDGPFLSKPCMMNPEGTCHMVRVSDDTAVSCCHHPLRIKAGHGPKEAMKAKAILAPADNDACVRQTCWMFFFPKKIKMIKIWMG